MFILIYCLALFGLFQGAQQPLPNQPFHDLTYPSRVFNESRHCRVILPPDYETSGKAYPVIYFFHGYSDRYTLESYDGGTDFIPKMVDYVHHHDVIVVLVDGYVARSYKGFYGGDPWDVRIDGGDWDFGANFKELVAFIDGKFRTLTDRRHRATSGLSMGGFMSLWLSARYPDMIGSASAFNPGPEFYTGDKGRRSLWRPKDHVDNHTHSMVRLIRASGDFISQYHEETRAAYSRNWNVDFEYRRDEYYKHWITSVAETFDFHARAFANPTLDNVPVVWSYDNPYNHFDVWGYDVTANAAGKGFTCLHNVRQGGFRVTTRQWAPDGPPIVDDKITIQTAGLYEPGQDYQLIDYDLTTGKTGTGTVRPDADGRITVSVDGAGHQVSFVGPGTGSQPPVVLPLTAKDLPRLKPGVEISLPVRIYNPCGREMTNLQAEVSSEYPTVEIVSGSADVKSISPGGVVDLSGQLRVRLTSGGGYFEPVRFQLRVRCPGWGEFTQPLDALVIPDVIPQAEEVQVLDGRAMTFKVFRQKGNRGGGGPVEVSVKEGKGNGNGILEPGEEATFWVRMKQGMDAFDKNTWHRCKVYSDSPYLVETQDIQHQKQLEWTGAMERTSLIRLSPDAPARTSIPVLLDNETWTYYYPPDLRFGKQQLEQAIQLHTHHLHRYELRVP